MHIILKEFASKVKANKGYNAIRQPLRLWQSFQRSIKIKVFSSQYSGDALRRLEMNKDAIKRYDRAIELDAFYKDAYNGKGL